MMIGNKSLTITRPNSYLYSGKKGDNKVPTVQPPISGCRLQYQIGKGKTGSVKAYGTADGTASSTETISTFDSEGIGFSYKVWTLLTKFDISSSGSSSIYIYPANGSGDIVNLTSTSTFNIICDYYSVNMNQFRGIYPEVSGDRFKAFKQIEYDGRYNLQVEDKFTIGDREYTVFNIDYPEDDFYVAFAGASR